MKRRDKFGAPARCCCVNEAETDEHTDFAHTRIREKIKESVFTLTRTLAKIVHREQTIGWTLSRGILVLVVFVAMLVIGTHAPRTGTGLVEYKYITGAGDGKPPGLMLNRDGKVVAITEEPDNDISFRSESLVVRENETMQSSNDCEYRVSMRSPETGRLDTFIVSRDIFNTLEIGSIVRFEIEMPHGDRIRRLISKDMNLSAHDSYYPEMNTLRQYMHE